MTSRLNDHTVDQMGPAVYLWWIDNQENSPPTHLTSFGPTDHGERNYTSSFTYSQIPTDRALKIKWCLQVPSLSAAHENSHSAHL